MSFVKFVFANKLFRYACLLPIVMRMCKIVVISIQWNEYCHASVIIVWVVGHASLLCVLFVAMRWLCFCR